MKNTITVGNIYAVPMGLGFLHAVEILEIIEGGKAAKVKIIERSGCSTMYVGEQHEVWTHKMRPYVNGVTYFNK